MIESLSNSEIIKLAGEAQAGGEYESARALLNREMQRRGLAIMAIHTIDMPVADPDEYIGPPHDHTHYENGVLVEDNPNIVRGGD